MLVKHNNNSISNITSAGQLAQGKMTLISSQTASGSSSISFTSGIDSTYPIYKFEFYDINLSAGALQFNMSTDGGSNYNVTKTTTSFWTIHYENDSYSNLIYDGAFDLAQSTSYQYLTDAGNNTADQSFVGTLTIFNPSSTTFVKHFIATTQGMEPSSPYSINFGIAGYGNTTNSINAIDFKPTAGTFNGTIKLYGIKGD